MLNMEQFKVPDDYQTNPYWGGMYESDGWAWWGGNALRWNVVMANTRIKNALEFCPKRGLALDIGASMGLYTFFLSMYFDKIMSFEPFDMNCRAFMYNSKNFKKACDVKLFAMGLSDKEEKLSMICDTGATAYADGNSGNMTFVPLDQMDLSPDFMKIDAEGMDLRVLKGAVETIKRCHPVIMIEDTRTDSTEEVAKREHREWYKAGEIPEFLSQFGYSLKNRDGIDFTYA